MSKSDADKLNEEARKVAEALGIGMAQWGLVENELFLLYLSLCKAGAFPNTSSIVYESLIHLETKLNAIDRLVDFRLKEKAALEDWSSLNKRIHRKARKVRNKLAHWRIWRDTDKGIAFLGAPLAMPPEQVPDFGTSHGGAMFAKDILGHARRITDLAKDIHNFIRKHVDPELPKRSE